MNTTVHVEVCIACGKISTPYGMTTPSKDCQRRGHTCTWQRHDMTNEKINTYCKQRGWAPLVKEGAT